MLPKLDSDHLKGKEGIFACFYFPSLLWVVQSQHKAEAYARDRRKDGQEEKQPEEKQALDPRLAYQYPFLLSGACQWPRDSTSHPPWFSKSPSLLTWVHLQSFFLVAPSLHFLSLLARTSSHARSCLTRLLCLLSSPKVIS